MSKATPNAVADNPELMQRPENTTTPRLFVAATRQNDGKTTTSLGLYNALAKRYKTMGFIKPIGQRFIEVDGLRVDEDTHLLKSIYNVDVPMEAMSPITIGGHFTRDYLRNPDTVEPQLVDKLCRAFDRAAYQKDFVIIEGSGHAGVGAVFNMSNARVAKILGAKAIIVSKGGIGRPVDEIAMNKALFDKEGVEVAGAIINKVHADKIDYIAEYAGRGLKRLGIPLLAVVPMQDELTDPNMGQIIDEIGARWINGRHVGENQRIRNVIIGAMTAKSVIDHIRPGVLIICPGDREDILLSAMATLGVTGGGPSSGIVLTRNMLPHPKLMEMVSMTKIPVAICAEDSYAVASKITSMTVKTQPGDADKIPIIQNLIADNLDIDRLLKGF